MSARSFPRPDRVDARGQSPSTKSTSMPNLPANSSQSEANCRFQTLGLVPELKVLTKAASQAVPVRKNNYVTFVPKTGLISLKTLRPSSANSGRGGRARPFIARNARSGTGLGPGICKVASRAKIHGGLRSRLQSRRHLSGLHASII